MRKLNETELYNLYLTPSQKSDIQSAIVNKLNQNTGIITPNHIETELTLLKTRSKSQHQALLNDALTLYNGLGGRIRLFNLGLTSNGRSPIPAYMPFIAARGRDRSKEDSANSSANGTVPVIFVNLYRIGQWSADESTYNDLAAPTDLYTNLETGIIAYKMLVEGKEQDIFSDTVVLENLTRIYTSLFSNAVVKTMITYGSDFQTDAARFLIAKFFLQYVLNKQQTDSIDDYALKAIKFRSSLVSLKNYEESNEIDYTSLSGFLKTLGRIFFNEEILLSNFTKSWLTMYGEATCLSVEYVPYLMHFLFAAYHGAYLGGGVRLQNRLPDLQKDGLIKLYNAIINDLR